MFYEIMQKSKESGAGHDSNRYGVEVGIVSNVKAKKFIVEAKEGDIELHAEKKIVLDCEDLEIKTSKTTKIDVGTNFSLKVDADASIKASGNLKLKASRVNIN